MKNNEVIEKMAQDISSHCSDLAESGCGETNCAVCVAEKLANDYAPISEKEKLATEILNDVMQVLDDSGTIEGWDYSEQDEVYGYKVQNVKTGIKKLFDKYGVKLEL